MFRAAFPGASEQEEKTELQWVKETFDLSGNNGTSKDTHISRLAGTWVGPDLALELGHSYTLGPLMNIVVDAKPDPNVNYRRSARQSNAAAPGAPFSTPAAQRQPPSVPATPAVASSLIPTGTPGTVQPPPGKRRRELSPISPLQSTPIKATPVRRSTRVRSPAPKAPATPGATTIRTPKPNKATARKEELVLTGSDATAVEEDGDVVEKAVASTDLHDQDVAEQKVLIEQLKSQREASTVTKEKESEGSTDAELAQQTQAIKRSWEDAEKPLAFNFREAETEEREIVSNYRIGRFSRLEPRKKSFAWGVAAFALGMSAV